MGRVYVALDLGPARQAGHGSGSSGVKVDVFHRLAVGRELRVETSRGGPPIEMFLFSEWLHLHSGRDVSFPVDLHADRWEQDVTVAGQAVPFVFVGNDDRWVAEGAVAPEHSVKLHGSSLDGRQVRLDVADASAVLGPG